MKKLTFLIFTLLFAVTTQAQTNWYAQNSGVNNYLFDVYFTDHQNGWIAGLTGLILHTNDGGQTWYDQEAPPSNFYSNIYFTDPLTGWATGFSGKIIHTTDGGQTWEFQESGTSTGLSDIQFLDENTGWIVGGDNGVYPSNISHRWILSTNNGGSTWSAQVAESYESPLSAVHFIDENNGWAVGEFGIVLHTVNGGSSWQELLSESSYHFRSVFFINEQKGWISGTYLGLPHVEVIYKTTDGGETWTVQEFDEELSLTDVHFTDENTGWVVGGSIDQSLIMHTTDGGETWIEESNPSDTYLSSVFFVDNSAGWAVGYDGTVVSTSALTGIDNNTIAVTEQALIYPNPAKDNLNIQSSDALGDVLILNLLGKIMIEQDVPGQQARIDLTALPAGIYFVRTKMEGQITNQKLIVE